MVGSDRTGSPSSVDRRGVGNPGRRRNRRGSSTLAALAVVASVATTGMASFDHVVAGGESLWVLAQRYATTPQAIARANHITTPDLIQIGKTLHIPGNAVPPPPATAPASGGPAVVPPAPTVIHAVTPGESLNLIASRYSVSIDALAAFNGIANPNLIQIGQVLKVPVPGTASVEGLLGRYSTTYKVDPALVKALAWQESGWQQQVVSSLGAVGVMQLMPETGKFTEDLLQHPVDPANVQHNVEAGVAFLAYLLGQTNGNQSMAVAGYYQGLRSVQARGMLPDTRRYVANVMALKQRFAQ